jgi:hypothetical protein
MSSRALPFQGPRLAARALLDEGYSHGLVSETWELAL